MSHFGLLRAPCLALAATLFACGSPQGDDPDMIPQHHLPPKTDESGTPINGSDIFSPQMIQDHSYLDIKDSIRLKILKNSLSSNPYEDASYPNVEDPALLVDHPESLVKNLQVMENKKLLKAELSEKPWSDYYWPTYRGGLGYRYADYGFPSARHWKPAFKYHEKNPAHEIVEDGDPAAINKLSPSEKYELLIGDANYTLTNFFWKTGEAIFKEHRKVETWFGSCHGWAAASFMEPRPSKVFTIKSADGKSDIKIYPADIKALLTVLWANGVGSYRHLGGRCNDKKPKVKHGRLVADDCFDINPGAWHISIVNQLGRKKRSLIMDVSYDYEVWNQPVYAYEYSYIHPETGLHAKTLEEGMEPIETLKRDKFKKFRSKDAKYVVGVSMQVSYVAESTPRQSEKDLPMYDTHRTARYRYDLELDEDKNIIGGEWHLPVHPDFLWVPVKDSKAESVVDQLLKGDWQPAKPLPDGWEKPIQTASEKGQPVAKIVRALAKLSQKEEPRPRDNRDEPAEGDHPSGDEPSEDPDADEI